MKVKQFSHLAFNCRNLDKSVKFYRNVLGCKVKFTLYYGDIFKLITKQHNKRIPFLSKLLEKYKERKWIVYMEISPGNFVELFDSMGAFLFHCPQFFHLNYQHFALEVEDIHKVREKLLRKGVKIDTDLQLGPDNTYQMWIHDPDSNKIEFMQYTEKSFQLVGRN